MITKELITRINYLARKQRYEGLSPEEWEEQQQVRRQYLDAIRAQVVDALDSAGYQKKHELSCPCTTCEHPDEPERSN